MPSSGCARSAFRSTTFDACWIAGPARPDRGPGPADRRRSESRQRGPRDPGRVANVRKAGVTEIELCDASDILGADVPELIDELVGGAVVALIELRAGEEIGLRGVGLVVQEVLRNELLHELGESLPG